MRVRSSSFNFLLRARFRRELSFASARSPRRVLFFPFPITAVTRKKYEAQLAGKQPLATKFIRLDAS